ncbi:MAG: IS3 family transposase [Firmicutes bacterium]|jgi:transposase InsO family protein|nr:IS3 family transposase [Bacillota bacterium]
MPQRFRNALPRTARFSKWVRGPERIHRRSRYGTTRRDPKAKLSDDLVSRRFVADVPDRLWVADITEHPTDEGKLYLAAVIDVFSRKVVGWSMGETASAELAVNAVNMAIWNRRPEPGLIHHSDHGCQYTSLILGKTPRGCGIVGSMGTVGDALDNAVAESFFAALQTELLDRHAWPTRRFLASAVFEYIEGFHNRRRRHSALGYMSPMEYEAARKLREASNTHSAA